MTTIVTRTGKGVTLTWLEMDTNLNNLNNNKAEVNSPTFTGVPQAPTPAKNTNTVQIATTQFVESGYVNKDSNTGSANLPAGTTAQRTGAPSFGNTRANSDLNQMEWWNGTSWVAVGGGATGGPGNYVFVENDITVTQNYTITTNRNAMSAGPITIANGVTVTIPNGSVWSVI